MTVAPKKAAKSPAQAKAALAFAAGGRAAQAKAKAKNGGKPSKAQHAAGLKWAAAGRASQARAKAAAKAGKKAPVKAKKAALPVSQSTWTGPSLWLPGCNAERPTCIVTAIANHLLAATGVQASDASILELHERAGGDGSATIATVLEAAADYGLAGQLLEKFGPGDPEGVVPGVIYGVTMRRGYHAVLAHPYGMVSWCWFMAWSGEPQETWELQWVT